MADASQKWLSSEADRRAFAGAARLGADFHTVLSQQLRTPLGTILNDVQILRQSGTSGPIAEQTLDSMQRQLRQVMRILDDLLDLPIDQSSEIGASPRPASVRPLKVFVLEDDRDGAKSLARLLRLWGHDVRLAYNGAEALKAILDDPPEVALIDIGLPGMDGHEVARRIRVNLKATITLIALTGLDSEEDRARSFAAGCDHHLIKPAEPALLRDLLAKIST